MKAVSHQEARPFPMHRDESQVIPTGPRLFLIRRDGPFLFWAHIARQSETASIVLRPSVLCISTLVHTLWLHLVEVSHVPSSRQRSAKNCSASPASACATSH